MTKRVVIVAMDGVQLLDAAGPLDVFAEANAQAGQEVYRLTVVGMVKGAIRSSSGAWLMADAVVGDDLGEVHTLLVAGTPKASGIVPSERFVAWLKKTTRGAKRFGSVCSGAFMLAAAGLLDGRRVTTHWAVAERLVERFPKVKLDTDAIYLRDGRIRTAAGVTAGLDLTLALVEEDLGREIAVKVAAQLVMFFKRPGGQLQFSRHGESLPVGRSALQEVQRYIVANPATDLSVPTLAERMGITARHFTRIFTHEVGSSPAEWVQAARVNAARQMLERVEGSPKQVAAKCGFADANTMRRVFVGLVGVSPAEYRRRYVGARATED